MKAKFKETLWLLLRILLAAGIIGGMICFNYDGLKKALRNIDYLWIFPAFLLYAFHLFVGAWRWHLLLKVQKIRLTYWETFSLTMQGIFFSLALPGAIGGDFAKAGFVSAQTRKGEKLKGVFTILIDRIIGMIALFTLVGIIGILSFGFLRRLSGALEFVLYAVIAACIMAAGSVVVLFFHRDIEKIKFFSWFINIGDKYSKGALRNLINAMDEFKSQYKILVFCILISIIFVHLNLAAILYLIALGTGAENISFRLSALVISIGNSVGALPIFPSGLGARDLVVKNILEAGGIKNQATLIPLIFSCLILIFNLSGGIFFILGKKSANSAEKQDFLQ